MDTRKLKWVKKTLIFRTWERCRSLGNNGGSKKTSSNSIARSKSWHCSSTTSPSSSPEKEKRNKRCQVAPQGCFSVYVGSEKQRFVIKTEFANHPLFKLLLEDAESEYGYDSQGPILLPCDVDLFYKVLAEMESGDDDDGRIDRSGCSFARNYSLCSPVRRPSRSFSNKGIHGGYRILNSSQSRLLKMNGNYNSV